MFLAGNTRKKIRKLPRDKIPIIYYSNLFVPQLEEEGRTYRDIIQEDFLDTYFNLTLKSILALKWVTQHCTGLEYFMKADDDVFINVPKLMSYLNDLRQFQPSFITGNTNLAPKRTA